MSLNAPSAGTDKAFEAEDEEFDSPMGLQPENLIALIRDSFDESVLVYTTGSCYRLYLILRMVFPEAEPYYDWEEGHVYTKIGRAFYDIKGKHVFPEGKIQPMKDTHLLRDAHRWKYGR